MAALADAFKGLRMGRPRDSETAGGRESDSSPSPERTPFESSVHRVRPEFFERVFETVRSGAAPFSTAESYLSKMFERFDNFFKSQVEVIPVKLILDQMENKLYPMEEGDGRGIRRLEREGSSPFFYSLANHRLAHSSGAAALQLEFKRGETTVKRVHLNVAEEDPGDGHGVFSESLRLSPSSLTLFLKYAQEYIDKEKDMPMDLDGEDDNHVLWGRKIPVLALLVDYMREAPADRPDLLEVIVNHANAYYRLDRDLAQKILEMYESLRAPVTPHNFRIDILPIPRCASVISVIAAVNIHRFDIPSKGGGGGNDADGRDAHDSSKVEVITTEGEGEDDQRDVALGEDDVSV